MSDIDLSGIQEAVRRGPGKAEGAARFERAALAEVDVVCFDPTLTATGWSVLTHRELALTLAAYGTIKYEDGASSVEEKAAAGDNLLRAVVRVLQRVKQTFPDIEAVIEAPPTGQNMGKLHRNDSTETACRVIRDACITLDIPLRPMVNILKHKTRITGNRSATKNETKMMLTLLAESLPILGFPKSTNDNVRDSISVGLTDLHDRKG